MTERTHLLELVKILPESEIVAAERFLEFLVSKADDPVLKAIEDAVYDDEPLTAEDIRALQEAEVAEATGRIVPDERVEMLLKDLP